MPGSIAYPHVLRRRLLLAAGLAPLATLVRTPASAATTADTSVLDWYDLTTQAVAAAGYPEPVTQSRVWAIGWLAAAWATAPQPARYAPAALAGALHDSLSALSPVSPPPWTPRLPAYTFWRPVTAIRTGATISDPAWTPLFNTPRHPEYPSCHGGYVGAAQRLLEALASPAPRAGVHLTSTTAPGAIRTYPTRAPQPKRPPPAYPTPASPKPDTG